MKARRTAQNNLKLTLTQLEAYTLEIALRDYNADTHRAGPSSTGISRSLLLADAIKDARTA